MAATYTPAEAAVADIVQAEARLAEAVRRRDNLIRAMLSNRHTVADVAAAFGLTRSRVYQIRDGVR